MKTTNKKVENLKQAMNLFEKAYYLQNSGKCLLHDYIDIDEDVTKIHLINTSTGLYDIRKELEKLVNNLIKK
jgi:hypothetical protein